MNNYRDRPRPPLLATLELMTDPQSLPGPLREVTLAQLGNGIITTTRNILVPLVPIYVSPHAPVIAVAQADVRPLLRYVQRLTLELDLAPLYIAQILTIPLVATKAGVDHFLLLPSFILRLHDESKALALPESPLSSSPSYVWLLGNLSYLLATQPRSHRLSEDVLAQALDVLASLLIKVPCGFVSDRGAITQHQEGSTYVTKVSMQTCLCR